MQYTDTTTGTVDSTVTGTAQPQTLDALRSRLTGTIAEPHEPAYQELVTAWKLTIEMRPAAVVAVRSSADVTETVAFARKHGMTVGVQATGHGAVVSLAGHLLIATRDLDEVTVHAEERWARVGAGVKWKAVIDAAAPHGLAPLNGSSSDVGVVGYTTGGGVGPMARTFGLASDRVRAFEVVTGDGVLRRVTPDRHPDLFFAAPRRQGRRRHRDGRRVRSAAGADVLRRRDLLRRGRHPGSDRPLAQLVGHAARGGNHVVRDPAAAGRSRLPAAAGRPDVHRRPLPLGRRRGRRSAAARRDARGRCGDPRRRCREALRSR